MLQRAPGLFLSGTRPDAGSPERFPYRLATALASLLMASSMRSSEVA